MQDDSGNGLSNALLSMLSAQLSAGSLNTATLVVRLGNRKCLNDEFYLNRMCVLDKNVLAAYVSRD